MPTLAVDLDGVLCHGIGRYEERTPDPQQIARVRDLAARGWRVVIWTSREATFEGKRRTESWLRRFDVPFDGLVLGKPRFDVLIDDKATAELPSDLDAFVVRAMSLGRFRSVASRATLASDDELVDREPSAPA